MKTEAVALFPKSGYLFFREQSEADPVNIQKSASHDF
jgi:hypothetical protein